MKKYIKYTEFFKIKEKELASLYIFTGEQHRLKEKGVEYIKKILFPEGESTFNLEQFHTPSPKEVEEALSFLPLNAKRRLILIKEWDKMQKIWQKECIKLFSTKLACTHCLIIFCLRKDSVSFFGQIRDCVFVDFSPSVHHLTQWVMKQALLHKKSMDYKVASHIVKMLGSSLSLMEKEMEKLLLFLEGKDSVEMEDVLRIIAPSEKVALAKVFEQILLSNREEAMRLFLRWSEGKEPLYVIASLILHLQRMFAAKEQREVEFLIQRQAQAFSIDWLKRALFKAYEHELFCRKGGRDTKLLPHLLLFRLCSSKLL